MQEGHLIAFESHKLDTTKERYSTHEKEMTTIIHYLETWKHYLIENRFTMSTDSVANTFFKDQKKLIAK